MKFDIMSITVLVVRSDNHCSGTRDGSPSSKVSISYFLIDLGTTVELCVYVSCAGTGSTTRRNSKKEFHEVNLVSL